MEVNLSLQPYQTRNNNDVGYITHFGKRGTNFQAKVSKCIISID